SQNQLRKFCKAHFLSYLRMREWRDIHTQLTRSLKELKSFRENPEAAEYDQIHRALLSGLLTGVGQLEEGNLYRATRNRKVMIFPGSGLFRKGERKKGVKKGKAPAVPKTGGPKWILAGEFMETTRLYARTVARIEPAWIIKAAEHVLTRRYTDPLYDEKGERVLVRERMLLYGLEIGARKVGYVRIDPGAATEIFIREALVEGRLRTRAAFHEANRELLEAVMEQQTRLRVGSEWALEERMYRFYADRLENVGSYADLRAFLKDRHGGSEAVLRMTEADLLGEAGDGPARDSFPDTAELLGVRLDLEYAYRPGDEEDGATLKVPVEAFEGFDPGMIDWVVPGYIRQRIEYLLRGLPKAVRKELFPLADLAQELALKVSPEKGALLDQLSRLLEAGRGIRIQPRDWPREAVPEYLQPRIEVVDRKDQTIAAGRNWENVRQQYGEAVRSGFSKGEGRERLEIWKAACARHERENLRPGDFPSLPRELHLGDLAGLPVKAWPGLKKDPAGVHLRLFTDPESAAAETRKGFSALCEEALGRDLGWLERDLGKELRRVALGFAFLMDSRTLAADAFDLLRRDLLACPDPLLLEPPTMEKAVDRAREKMRGLAPRVVDLLEEILHERDRVLQAAGKVRAWQLELEALVHKHFLRELGLANLYQYPRYIKALFLRIERARRDPGKDAAKAGRLTEFVVRFQKVKAPPSVRRRLRWLLEEYKVQVFAQELGTPVKVSPRVIEGAFAEAEAQSGRRA
ncbi:MAG TPA: DUF3418 domain-containing protein, partial [Oceanipulchritudo sp.]|nr:DUF3418 domain-containing protein [Oceanipulchritudo sp.]